jgi:hypothetical protein
MNVHNCTLITDSDSTILIGVTEQQNFTGNRVFNRAKWKDFTRRKVSDAFWSFLIGLLVGVPTGVLGGVLLVAALAKEAGQS